MTILLTGNGSVGQRFGHIFGIAADLVAIQGGTATAGVTADASMATRGTTLETDAAYTSSTVAVSPEIDGHWTAIASWRSSQSSLFSSLKQIAEKVMIRMADADANLATKDLTSALKELRRQMRANGTSIEASSVSAGAQTTVTATGTAKIVTSVKDVEGYTLQTPFAETLRFTVSSDAQSGGATARNESVNVRGKAAVPDTSNYLWSSAGSGCNVTVNIVDSQSDNSRGNLLYSSGFDDFNSTNYPASWVIAVGTSGTNVFAAGSSDDYSDGGNALKITGDVGGTLVTLRHTFDTTANTTTAGSGGTPAELEPLSQYAVGLWYKRDNALSAGVLRVALVDGDGTVTNDASGTANSFTVDVTAATASYAFASGTFRTPAAIPSTGFKLELKTTTAIDSGDSLFIDDVAMTEMTPLYNGGPSVAMFAGSTNAIKDDQWTVAISNTMGKFAMWFERFFAMRDKGVQLPYSGSPTIDDDLVV